MNAIRAFDENGAQTEHCFQLGVDPRDARPMQLPSSSVVSATVGAATVAAGRPPQKPAADQSITTAQLIKQLRARLRVVEREIKARQGLEEERGKINRLLSAAKTERDNVRRLRTAG